MSLGVVFAVVCVVGALAWLTWRRAAMHAANRAARRQLEASRSAAVADLLRFAEELVDLDAEIGRMPSDEALIAEHTESHAKYELASNLLAAAKFPQEVEAVTELIDEGRYAACCVRARIAHRQRPLRRPPCFFNPAHGPSECNVTWESSGSIHLNVPACAADAERLACGAQPNIRTVPSKRGRVPYWEGGHHYAPWAQGYFGSWRGSSLAGDVSGAPVFREAIDNLLAS